MHKSPEDFTKLDSWVKAFIMQSPLISTSRIGALSYLFLTQGNGFFWNLNTGDIDNTYNEDMYQHPNTINSSNIIGRENSMEAEFMELQHRFVEKHIDEIATKTINRCTCNSTIHSISEHDSEGTLIQRLTTLDDVSKIDIVWRNGALELAEWFLLNTREFYSLDVLTDRSQEAAHIHSKSVKKMFLFFKDLENKILTPKELKIKKQREHDTAKMILEMLSRFDSPSKK